MNDDKPKSATEIAEGLPPSQRIDDEAAESAEHDLRVNEPSAMQVFFVWEKLRILYNVILIVALGFLFTGLKGEPLGLRDLGRGLFIVFLMNVWFCAGPVGEGYLSLFGVPCRVSRGIMLAVIAASAVLLFLAIMPGGLGDRQL
jgi:hypothetical protein